MFSFPLVVQTRESLMKRSVMASMIAIAAVTVGTFGAMPSAHAQGKAPAAATGGAGGAAAGSAAEGYGYTFSDDPLSAGGFGPNDATIRVRPNAVRNTLIRPRTSFVPEMLKSVENL
jgi:hypothetical protein